jgi:BNR repeat-containing family member
LIRLSILYQNPIGKENNTMKIVNTLIIASAAGSMMAQDFKPSPWDKGQAEIKGSIKCPVKFASMFTHARSNLGYNPRFQPAMVSFGASNAPYIRVGGLEKDTPGSNGTAYPKGFYSTKNFIQTLGKNGKWLVSTSHLDAIRKHLKLSGKDKLEVLAGERITDSVQFDNKGRAYTIACAKYHKNGKRYFANFLLFSKDKLKTWQVLPVKRGGLRLEPFRPNTDNSQPPVMTSNKKSEIWLYVPVIAKDGTLKLSTATKIAGSEMKVLLHGVMAGNGAQCVTAKGKTFISFCSLKAQKGVPGVLQYVISYDHKTGKVSKPVYLGSTGHRIDGHNSPVIDIDSKGFLHVIGGAHWHAFKHWQSTKPYSIISWSKPVKIGAASDNAWSRDGVSYPGFLIDGKDNLHLVCRGRNSILKKNDKDDPGSTRYGNKLDYALIYFRKKTGQNWESRRDLAIPFWRQYSNWYQKISIDHKDNLYVTYYYIAMRIARDAEASKKYLAIWPEDVENGKLLPKNVKAHDPVIISSNDSGNSWSITRTKDFLKNLSSSF